MTDGLDRPARPADPVPGPGEVDASDLAGGAAERARRAPPVATPDRRRGPQPDLDAALDMLNRAARAMDAMQARYRQIEEDAKEVAARAEQDLAAAVERAREWEARARSGDGRQDDLERRLRAAEDRAAEAERAAAALRQWLDAFYDKVLDAFETCPVPGASAA